MTGIHSKVNKLRDEVENLKSELEYYKRRDEYLKRYLDQIENHLIKSGTIYLDTGSDLDWYELVVNKIVSHRYIKIK